jgi:hypothetical protein
MRASDWKLIEDLREKIYGLIDPRDFFASKVVENFHGARKELTERAGKLRAQMTVKFAREWDNTRLRLDKLSQVLEDCVNLRLNVLADSIRDSPRLEQLSSFPMSAFMQPPHSITTGRRYSGEPVYYVNGMWTDKIKATAAAEALAKHLKRPVLLIYNASGIRSPISGFGNGLVRKTGTFEVVYTTAWPLFACTMPSDILLGMGRGKIQRNSATRKLTYLLYNAKKPVSIISHSVGCIIVRNACFALFLLDREKWIRDNLAWVTTGIPLHDNVVWPKPVKYTSLIDKDDPVPKMIGFEDWNRIELSIVRFQHGFVQHYLPKITNEMIW